MDPNQQNFRINSQHSDNSQYTPENVQTSQKNSRDHPWDTKEDIALMNFVNLRMSGSTTREALMNFVNKRCKPIKLYG